MKPILEYSSSACRQVPAVRTPARGPREPGKVAGKDPVAATVMLGALGRMGEGSMKRGLCPAIVAALVAVVVGIPGPGLANLAAGAAGGALAVVGEVVTATGRLDATNRLDPDSIDGVAPAAGAVVRLGWLREADPKTGDGALVQVAAAVADVNGRYSLDVSPDVTLAAAAAANDGWANFLLTAAHDGVVTADGVTRHWTGTGWDAGGREELEPRRVLRTYLARDPVTGESLSGTLDPAAHGPAAVGPATVGPDGILAPYDTMCSYSVVTRYTAYTKVVEFHNSADSDGSWGYGTTADSDIALGLKPAAGVWSAGGAWHVGNSTGATVGFTTSAAYDRFMLTIFEYEKIHLTGNIRTCYVNNYDVVYAKRWLGGVWEMGPTPSSGCIVSPQSAYRVQYLPGGSFRRWQNRAGTFSVGVGLGFVNLDATSGHSAFVEMSWRAVRNWIYICGSNDYPTWSRTVYVW